MPDGSGPQLFLAPQEQMVHEGFPEDERGHLGIRLIMEQMVKWMLHRLDLAAILLIAVHVQRQTRNGLRQVAHTGVHRRHLHGGPFVHALFSCGSSHEETVRTAGCGVLGAIEVI